MDPKLRIGFIGAGNMAQAIGQSIISKGVISVENVFVSAPTKRNFCKWREIGVKLTHNNHEVILQSNVVFLAVKPQFLDQVLTELPTTHPSEYTFKLIVSLLAGLSCETLHKKLKPVFGSYRLIRMIPNTSLLVGEGFSAICPDISASEDDVNILKLIASAGGIYEIVPESLLSTVSALSGSGVAFCYQIIEGLSDGAVKQGVPRALSYRLAAQTLLGASKMILDTNEHPAVLKDNVCSPGGTTICGIHALERGGLRSTLMNAIDATVVRFNELDKEFKEMSEKKT